MTRLFVEQPRASPGSAEHNKLFPNLNYPKTSCKNDKKENKRPEKQQKKYGFAAFTVYFKRFSHKLYPKCSTYWESSVHEFYYSILKTILDEVLWSLNLDDSNGAGACTIGHSVSEEEISCMRKTLNISMCVDSSTNI